MIRAISILVILLFPPVLSAEEIIGIKHNDKVFQVNNKIYKKHKKIVDLVLSAESIEDDYERQYWLNQMPTMNGKELNKLFKILDKEKKMLEQLQATEDEVVEYLNNENLSFQEKEKIINKLSEEQHQEIISEKRKAYFRIFIDTFYAEIKASPKSIFIWVSSFIIIAIYVASVLFPYWPIFRNKISEKIFFNKIFLIIVSPILIKRITKFCNTIAFPKISFLPIPYRVDKDFFLAKYIPISLIETGDYVHETAIKAIKDSEIKTICLHGEGGMGKTLSSYKISFELSNNGYIPIIIDSSFLPEEITFESMNLSIGEFFKNNHIIDILNKLGFSKYSIIIDNFSDEDISKIASQITGIFPDSIVTFTTRNKQTNNHIDLNIELNSKTVDFNHFINHTFADKAKVFKSFILEIKNILLISIIMNNNIDLTEIVRNKNCNIKTLRNKILDSYIIHQILNIGEMYLKNIKTNHSIYLIEQMLCLLANKSKGTVGISNYLDEIINYSNNDTYFKEILELIKSNSVYKSNIQILDLLENSSITHTTPSHTMKFTHDLIYEFIAFKCQNKANKLLKNGTC